MKAVDITQIKPGDILAVSAFSKTGEVLLTENTTLTEEHITKLENSGIHQVFLKTQEPFKPLVITKNEADAAQETFKAVKEKSKTMLIDVYRKVINFDVVSVTEIFPVIDDIIDVTKGSKKNHLDLLNRLIIKDDYTYSHSLNTCFLALVIGENMGLNEEDLRELGVGALMHDIGKLSISSNILSKNSSLTEDEYNTIKNHTVSGYNILSRFDGISQRSALVALNHHEKVNGKGYPRGLIGDEIDVFSKITCICDIYDALINARHYKKCYKPNECFEYILSMSGVYFELDIAKVFSRCIVMYPDGVSVMLSNGYSGYVLRQNVGYPQRPVIRVACDNDGNMIDEYDIDLMSNLNIVIYDVL